MQCQGAPLASTSRLCSYPNLQIETPVTKISPAHSSDSAGWTFTTSQFVATVIGGDGCRPTAIATNR